MNDSFPKKVTPSLFGAIPAGALASACCIGPLLILLLGFGSASAFIALEPYRPFFAASTFGLLGWSLWQHLANQKTRVFLIGRGYMKSSTLLKTGITGIVISALCCFTPVLAVLLGIAGLAAWGGYLDYVLVPALLFFLALTVFALKKKDKERKANAR